MATAPFFTKKQKANFQKRRRRLKKADASAAGTSTRGRISAADQHTNNNGQEQSNSTTTTNLVLVPKDLSVQEAKKFRKEARRKARAAGQDASDLQFVVAQESGADNEKASVHNKKKKKDFPSLKTLVQEQEVAKEKQSKVESQRLGEESLSEEYKSRYVACDCEMVGIGTDGKRSVLARVSLVDWNGNVLLDTFVQVPARVTDYRTHVSGVRPKDISKGAAMKEKECCEKVSKLLQGKVLVGHALKNDLNALLLTHPRQNIRDTAKYRPFQRFAGTKWRSRKLRDLAKEHLGLAIQQEGKAHDSIQDAWTAMQLFRLVRVEWERSLELKSLSHKRRKESSLVD